MSLFQWVRYIACIVDEKFEVVDSIIIGRSFGFSGFKKTTFKYNGGIYNIKPSAFKVQTAIKSHLFFDDDIFIYQIGNPDPFKFQYNQFKPIMDAEVYKSRLENKLVIDLNSIAMGGPDWKQILKYLAIGAVLVAVAFFFINKNASVSETVINASVETMRPVVGGG